VATELQVAPSRLRLVAEHAWDVPRRMRAGCAAAFIARPGRPLYPLADKPDFVGPALRNAADQILRARHR
jgi:2-haloacid dehalogenase